MNIMVIGGAGYIGSVLVPLLQGHGHDVGVVDLFWFGNHLPPEVPVLRRDAWEMTPADLAGYDQVIFLAGLSNDPMANFDPARNWRDNGALPGYVAWSAARAGVSRVIYASSHSVYGTPPGLAYEWTPCRPGSAYGHGKLLGEAAVWQTHEGGHSVIVLRQATVAGYSPRLRLDLVVNRMVRDALREGVIRCHCSTTRRPIVDVRDAAAAFLAAVAAAPEVNGTYNVVGGNYTVGQLAEAVREVLAPRLPCPPHIDAGDQADARSDWLDRSAAATALGWRPRVRLEETIFDLWQHRAQIAWDDPGAENLAVFRRLFGAATAGKSGILAPGP